VVWPGSPSFERRDQLGGRRSREKAERFARDHGIPRWFLDYAELITAPDVDAVFVGVPNFLHESCNRPRLAERQARSARETYGAHDGESRGSGGDLREQGLVLMIDQESRLADGVRDLPPIIESMFRCASWSSV